MKDLGTFLMNNKLPVIKPWNPVRFLIPHTSITGSLTGIKGFYSVIITICLKLLILLNPKEELVKTVASTHERPIMTINGKGDFSSSIPSFSNVSLLDQKLSSDNADSKMKKSTDKENAMFGGTRKPGLRDLSTIGLRRITAWKSPISSRSLNLALLEPIWITLWNGTRGNSVSKTLGRLRRRHKPTKRSTGFLRKASQRQKLNSISYFELQEVAVFSTSIMNTEASCVAVKDKKFSEEHIQVNQVLHPPPLLLPIMEVVEVSFSRDS
ncbi:hypothetical protein M9H77_11422 [Catharanthus roseus]|uniref:Uncharacterized protein n=1 Tax=Catharanthus roseus TaxID=4058 RepID=A0ACC0BEK6_CATRO|nr:hypothetical protein M9H77_11422 [Catharanthus roseus]